MDVVDQCREGLVVVHVVEIVEVVADYVAVVVVEIN